MPRHTYIRGVQVPGQRINSREHGYQGINIAAKLKIRLQIRASKSNSANDPTYSKEPQLNGPILKLPVSKDKELLSVLQCRNAFFDTS